METYISQSVSSHPCSQDCNYNNMMSCLQNLDLSSGNRGSCSRNNDHGGICASHYSWFSPKPQCVDQGNSVRGPQLLDRTPPGRQSNKESHHAPVPSAPPSFIETNTFSDQERKGIYIGPGYPWMYREANQVPGILMPGGTFPAYHPSYMGVSALSQNGCFGPGFTETKSNGQNGYDNQEFTESSNGFLVQSPESKTNQQDFVSVAMRNGKLMFLQYDAMDELVQCRRILNQILRQSLPQLEAKMAVPRDGQQTPNRISGSAQGLPGPTISTRIFVGGLASTVTESDFKTYFDQFGTITNVEIKYDHITQRTRGFGFITFDSEKAVDKVLLRTSFHELNGKMVEVKRAFPKDLYRKSIRGQLGGLNYGLRKVSNLLGAYAQANRHLFPRIMI